MVESSSYVQIDNRLNMERVENCREEHGWLVGLSVFS
jgi:hypothetical protein